MKKFKEFNESLRDKMSPVTEEDIKDKLGEENYKKYIQLLDARDSIKNKMLVMDDVVIDKKRDKIYFEVQVMLKSFDVSIEDGKWVVNYRIGYDNVDKYFDTWEEARERIRDVIRDDLNKDINEKQEEIDKLQSDINKYKERIAEIDENI